MSQEIIDVGASANDGQGDPIRTAFIKTNNNFTELFGIGASQIIYNGTSNVNIPFLNGNVFISVAGVSNVMVVDSGGANIAGTLAVTGNITGGNLRTAGAISSAGTITGVTLVGDYVQGILTTPTQTQITSLGTLISLSVTGNVNPGNLITTGIVSATGAILAGGNVSGLNLRTPGLISATGSATAGNVFSGGLVSAAGNIIGGNMSTSGDVSITGNLTVGGNATLSGNILGDRIQNGTTSFDIQTQNGNANITVGGTSNVVVFADTGVYANGVISATGNIAGNYFIGNGSQLSGLAAAYGNAEMVANLAALGSNPVSTTGNVTATYIIGNGSLLTNLPAGDYSNANVANYLPTYTGNLVSLTGPVTTTTDITGGNILTGGLISATGNITGNYIIGNGSQLTGLIASVANINNGTSNVTVVSSNGNISVGINNTSNVVVWSITGEYVTGIISATGNIRSGGNISAVGSIQGGASGNVFGGNLRTTGYASAAGNVIGGNILTGGSISASGNIISPNFVGNLVPPAGGIVSTTGNIFGNNLNAVNLVINNISSDDSTIVSVQDGLQVYGNIIADNLVINNISSDDSTIVSVQDGLQVYGNIIADNLGNIASINLDGNASTVLYGNGTFAPVAGGNSSYGDSNVTTLLSNLGGNTISTTANVTGNYFIGNGSQLTGVTASANTGNVTFDDQIVIGTGSDDGTGGLYLAPGNASIANSAVQYLRVRGGDVATHIHLDTGNNQYYDQYFGDDGKYVKLVNTGNVEIGSDNAGNTYSWTFGTDGNLTLPGNLVIAGNTSVFGTDAALLQTTDDKPLIAISSGANGAVSSLWVEDIGNVGTSNIAAVYANPTPGSGIVRIAVGQNGNAGPNLWDFDATGNLTLPDAGGLGTAFGYTALKGGNLGGALLYQDVTTYMGVDNVGTITLTANSSSWVLGNASNDGNAVMLLPGDYKIYQPGVSILSIEAPANTNGVSLNYLGGTSLTVGNISNVNVVTVTNTGNSWTFKADGVIQCPLVSVDDLPLATTPGLRAMVYDASNPPTSFGNIVGNVGSNVLPVFSDGANWRVG